MDILGDVYATAGGGDAVAHHPAVPNHRGRNWLSKTLSQPVPENRQVMDVRGRECERLRLTRQAMYYYTMALPYATSDYDKAGLYYSLARCANRRGDLIHALEKVDKALQLSPNYGAAINFQAILLWELGEYDASDRARSRFVELFPTNVDGLLARAIQFNRRGSTLFAANDADKIIRLTKSFAALPDRMLRPLYHIFIDAGRHDSALDVVNEVLRRFPNDATFRMNLARTLIICNRLTSAVQAFTDCLSFPQYTHIALHHRLETNQTLWQHTGDPRHLAAALEDLYTIQRSSNLFLTNIHIRRTYFFMRTHVYVLPLPNSCHLCSGGRRNPNEIPLRLDRKL
jgi:tetratricopeptide (TPR) repeat protein